MKEILEIFRKEAGFTFMEIMVSMVVLTVIATAGMGGMTYSRKGAALAQQKTIAAQLAEKKLVQIKNTASPAGSAPTDDAQHFLNHGTVEVVLDTMATFPGGAGTDNTMKLATVTIRWDDVWKTATPGSPADARDYSLSAASIFFVKE